MSKIQRIEELLVTYRLRKEVMSEAEERLMDWQERVNNAADELAETVTDLQELGFDVAAFEETDDTINDLIDEEEVEASEQDEKHSEAPPMPEGDGWKRNTGEQPFAGSTQVETVHEDGSLQHGGASDHFWDLDDERINKIIWYRKAQPDTQAEPVNSEALDELLEMDVELYDAEGPAPERKFKAGDRVRDKLRGLNGEVTGYTENGSVEYQIYGRDYTALSAEAHLELIDHFAEVTAQIEASIDEREEAAASSYNVGQKVIFEGDNGEKLSGEITLVGQDYSSNDPWYNIKADDTETYVQVAHDELTLVEDQAESESAETEAESPKSLGDILQEAMDSPDFPDTVETVDREEPEASSDEEPVENEPRFLATHSSVSDEHKPVTVIDDTQGVTSYTVRGED